MPSPQTPAIRIEQIKGKNPAVLYRVVGEGYGYAPGVTVRTLHYDELCEAPCEGILDSRGEFFVGGQGYGNSKRFRLEGNHTEYTLRVKPRSKGLAWGGWATMGVGLIGGTLLLIAPVLMTTSRSADGELVEVPKSTKTGFIAGAAVVYVAGLAGGFTLFAFSRTKVEVLPGLR